MYSARIGLPADAWIEDTSEGAAEDAAPATTNAAITITSFAMDNASLIRLLSLSAIWGGSFLFMRVAVPVLGPELLVLLRVLLAAVFLCGVSLWLRRVLAVRRHWAHYLILGLFNSALPFALFAHAALQLPASLLSILNATAPLWGGLIGALWLRVPLSGRAMVGLCLGVAGVGMLAGFELGLLPPGSHWAMLAALAAAVCYGAASTYAKSVAAIDPLANAHGSMWAATLMTMPLMLLVPLPEALPSADILAAVLALGVLCSGMAYLLYFRLIADVGAASALTVTFLIPMFGIFWGWLFLGERVGWHTLAGSLLVIAGTALTTNFSLRVAFSRGKGSHA